MIQIKYIITSPPLPMTKDRNSHIGYNNIYEVIFAYLYTWSITLIQAKYLYDASLPMRSHLDSYYNHRTFLPQRWFGMHIDLSDWQWVTFDYHFPKQVLFAIAYIIIMQSFKRCIRWSFRSRLNASNGLTRAIRNITDLYTIINIGFCLYLHGTSTFFMLIIMAMSYMLSIATYQWKYCNLIAWAWNLMIGVIVSKYDHSYFAFSELVHPSLKWLDQWIPVNMRWNQVYRLTMLRSISFHMDLRSKYLGQTLYQCPFQNANGKYRDYVEVDDFSMINFFAYTLYTPLMVSGPIMSFTEWMNQIKCMLLASH